MARALILISLTAALASHSSSPTDLDAAEKAAPIVLDELTVKYGADKLELIVLAALPKIQMSPALNGSTATARNKDKDATVNNVLVTGQTHPNDLDGVFAWAAGVVDRALASEPKRSAPVLEAAAQPS